MGVNNPNAALADRLCSGSLGAGGRNKPVELQMQFGCGVRMLGGV